MGLIAPDTCPRGAGVPGETDSWDFGQGAGFYLDATTELWKDNYRMYSYITKELPTVLTENFPTLDLSRMGITGHSMGGHGALTIGLKNPKLFRSVSAFAPICNPINGEWGKKAFTGYLGGDPKDLVQRKEYDACSLIASRAKECGFDDILVDQGTGDNFYKSGQLMPEALQKACEEAGQKVTIRFQEGFDHSYYFISTFIEDHVRFHAARLV
jgi:S-formylglutathione hydrolase